MKKLAIILTIASLFIAISCDNVSGPETDEVVENHMFEFELVDEHGNVVEVFSNEKAGEVDIGQSAGLFGDRFLPPEMVERITGNTGMNEEELRRNTIILHAEQEIDGELNYISMNFKFQNTGNWQEGTHFIIERSEEFIIERFRRGWEIRQEIFNDMNLGKKVSGQLAKSQPSSQNVNANYLQYGFRNIDIPYSFQSMGGEVVLDEVTNKHLTGRFSIELLGLPTDIYQMDELPEELDTVKYSVKGTFTALLGGYEDLLELQAGIDGAIFIL